MRVLLARCTLVVPMMALGFAIAAVPIYAQTTPTPVPTANLTASPAVSDDEVNRISKGLYCPICQNVPLEVCETDACARWREQVRELLAQGQTEQQIHAYFVEHFGAQTLGIPTNPVVQLLTIALPFALIAIVGLLIGINLVIWRNKHPPIIAKRPDAPADSTPQDDNYRAQLEDEIKKRD